MSYLNNNTNNKNLADRLSAQSNSDMECNETHTYYHERHASYNFQFFTANEVQPLSTRYISRSYIITYSNSPPGSKFHWYWGTASKRWYKSRSYLSTHADRILSMFLRTLIWRYFWVSRNVLTAISRVSSVPRHIAVYTGREYFCLAGRIIMKYIYHPWVKTCIWLQLDWVVGGRWRGGGFYTYYISSDM